MGDTAMVEKSDGLDDFVAKAPIFFQRWWLETVSPGGFDYAVERKGEKIVGVFAYPLRKKLGCWTLIEMPSLTPYLGPWVGELEGKYVNRLSAEKEILQQLIGKLPPFASLQLQFHPWVTNWLPFHWEGYEQTTRYTYRIAPSQDSEAVWEETRQNIRTDVRKARERVKVIETRDIERFLRLHRMTFRRQGRGLPHAEKMLRRLEAECARRGAGKLLVAEDVQGKDHAGVFVVNDAEYSYYFLSGGDPALRQSGATSLLVWRAIEEAVEAGRGFDFEGSMVEPIERFCRGFGARQTPYFAIRKCNSRVVRAYRGLRRGVGLDA